MQVNNNILTSANSGRILVDQPSTYDYLYKFRNTASFNDAMTKLDTFTKNGGVDIEIGKLASGGGIISKVNPQGTKEVLAADGRDIVKCMQVALKKLEGCAANAMKATKSA